MPDEVEKLLAEIRDTQREHLAEYRRVTGEMMKVQQLAVKRQARSLLLGIVALAVVFGGMAIMLVGWARGGR